MTISNVRSYLMEQVLVNFMAKNREGLLSFLTDDIKLIDPNYPELNIEGKKLVAASIDLAFDILQKPKFTVRRTFLHAEIGVMEVDCQHRLADGAEVKFRQVFVIETSNGLISSLQIYVQEAANSKYPVV